MVDLSKEKVLLSGCAMEGALTFVQKSIYCLILNYILNAMRSFLILCFLFLMCGFTVQAQVKVQGLVRLASDKEPIAGATVLIKGMNTGTVTDMEGRFSLTLNTVPTTLSVSFLGMKTKEVKVISSTPVNLDILLEEDQTQIDEVVVIGYGTVRKSDLTGSVSTMKGSDVGNAHMLSLDQSMAGRMAGVNITNTSGEPGAGISIQIRGTGSINSDSEPLYVIDGAPITKDAGTGVGNIDGLSSAVVNPLSSINPNDIHSIEILKDASATAIYGSRGANGVVLITTKSGMVGKPVVTFGASVGFSNVSKKIDVLNGTDYLNYMAHERKDNTYIEKYDSLMNTPSQNWQDALFKTAITQDYNVGVRGGTENTKYALSAAYTDQQGTVDNSGFNRFTIRSRIDQNIGKRMKVGVNLSYAAFTQDGVPSGGSKDAGADVFQQALTYRPVNYRSNETDLAESGELSDDYNMQSNPKDYVQQVRNTLNNTRMIINTYAEYEFMKGLLFKTSYNLDDTKTDKNIFYPASIAAGAATNGRGTNAWAKRRNWSWENLLTYSTVIHKDHSINAILGYTMEKQTGRNFSIETRDYMDVFASLPGGNVGHGLSTMAPVVSEFSSTLVSYLGRINYSYKGKYLFTASVRSDGSSKFPKGKKFSYFPSVALAWNMKKESFMKSLEAIEDLKLRLSYGRTGNQGIPPYSSQEVYANVYYSFNQSGGMKPSSVLKPGIIVQSIANPDLTWETTEQYNVGLDLGLLRNRITLSVDAYFKKTFDLLLSKPLDYSMGFATMMYNSGSLENKGLEFVLNTVNVSHRNFSWTSSFNLSFNRNKVLDLGDNAALTFNGGNLYNEAFILQPGQPVGTMYGFIYDGVYTYADYKNFYIDQDPSKGLVSKEQCTAIYERIKGGAEKAVLMDGQPKYAGGVPLPGSAKFRDIVGEDNNVTPEDRTYIGNSAPKFFGGFVNKFEFKGFDINLFMQFSYGNKFLVANYFPLQGYDTRNILQDIYDNAWRPYRDSNIWPDYTIDSYKSVASSMVVEDGSYLKIKDLTIGYTFPTQWLNSIGISKARIYLTGQNLFTFTKFKWYDPEVASNNPIMGGFYRFTYPSSRTIITGISLSF